jgi:hypothetical protein
LLPEAVRAGILAMVQVTKCHKRGKVPRLLECRLPPYTGP